jgi:hypothetical protein
MHNWCCPEERVPTKHLLRSTKACTCNPLTIRTKWE